MQIPPIFIAASAWNFLVGIEFERENVDVQNSSCHKIIAGLHVALLCLPAVY